MRICKHCKEEFNESNEQQLYCHKHQAIDFKAQNERKRPKPLPGLQKANYRVDSKKHKFKEIAYK